MGYSCTVAAADTLSRLAEILAPRLTDSSNSFKLANGTEGFWERGRENRDGAVTGKVWRSVGGTFVKPAGSFRINPDGKVARFPLIPAEILRRAEDVQQPRSVRGVL